MDNGYPRFPRFVAVRTDLDWAQIKAGYAPPAAAAFARCGDLDGLARVAASRARARVSARTAWVEMWPHGACACFQCARLV